MKKRTIILLFLTFLIVCCCTNQHSDHRLTLVEKLAETDPKMALDSLNRIDYNNLSDADRQYYDFLTIKVKDKAFVAHTSDSLILKVIKNEEKNQNRGRYAEALYYGGRVCHDLGDYPTALNYYHNALEKNPSKKLEGCIVIQIGSILNSLRLYEQAIPYIKRAIAIDSCLHDSINLVYDIDHLGATLNCYLIKQKKSPKYHYQVIQQYKIFT
jgi:tetratricopeptide (TPR) repeat protein